ncbi:MAG: hypothetical protein WC091_02625 [Sulfuricellaceae bacterium]
MLVIELPWPPKELMPNRARGMHWAAKGKIAKSYRAMCYVIAWNSFRAQLSGVPPRGRQHLSVVFVPPDKRSRDGDGLMTAMKAGFDAISEAIGLDDKYFRPVTYDISDNIEKNGKVVITLG